jgi:hypothetical protein
MTTPAEVISEADAAAVLKKLGKAIVAKKENRMSRRAAKKAQKAKQAEAKKKAPAEPTVRCGEMLPDGTRALHTKLGMLGTTKGVP